MLSMYIKTIFWGELIYLFDFPKNCRRISNLLLNNRWTPETAFSTMVVLEGDDRGGALLISLAFFGASSKEPMALSVRSKTDTKTYFGAARFRKTSPDAVHFSAASQKRSLDVMRLVLSGPPRPQAAQALLRDALAQWPENTQAKFLITPGAFIEAPWPSEWQGRRGWESDAEAVASLMKAAERVARTVLSPAIHQAARGKVKYLTLGVDLTTERKMKGPHVELVGVYDVQHDRFAGWTGKSYPLATQENTLVQVTDLGSHLLELDGERVLLLGCHDLNMFSPRAHANQKPGSERRKRSDAMRDLAGNFSPTIVLQHPHGTDTPNIWRAAWKSVERMFPDVHTWASAIGFYNFLNPDGKTRASLERTLKQTQSDETHVDNLVLDTRHYS